MIRTGSITDFGREAARRPLARMLGVCGPVALLPRSAGARGEGRAPLCEPKEYLAEHSCGCTVCVDQHDGFDLRWPGATHRGSAGGPTCAARTCHFGDVSKCTVL